MVKDKNFNKKYSNSKYNLNSKNSNRKSSSNNKDNGGYKKSNSNNYKKNNQNNSNNNNYFKKRNEIDNIKKSKVNSYQTNNSKSSQFFRTRYDEIFGKGTFSNLLSSKPQLRNNQFIRVNLSKTTVNEVEVFLKKNRVKYSKTFIDNALKIEKSFFNISSSIFSLTGKIYIQDLASQIPVNTIDFNKLKNKSLVNDSKIQILDMAASPGSKTTQIIDLLIYYKIPFKITALEYDKNRLNRLINNIQKQEFDGFDVEIINIDAQNFKTKSRFDIIILDAPCSGNLIDDDKWLAKRNMMGIEQNASLQKRLLKNALKLLKNDGELIYSTCSIEPEENELNIEWAIDKLNLKSIKDDFNKNIHLNFNTNPLTNFKKQKLTLQNSIRIMPFYSNTQGFFVAKLKKNI